MEHVSCNRNRVHLQAVGHVGHLHNMFCDAGNGCRWERASGPQCTGGVVGSECCHLRVFCIPTSVNLSRSASVGWLSPACPVVLADMLPCLLSPFQPGFSSRLGIYALCVQAAGWGEVGSADEAWAID